MSLKSVCARRPWSIALVCTIVLLILAATFLACGGTWAGDGPQLQAEDLLLLTLDALARVEAAAEQGDIIAQSTLGSAYLLGEHVPKNVTKAVYWFEKVVSRDEQEYQKIRARMGIILEQRKRAENREENRKLELEYLDLVMKKLSYEEALTGLLQVYSGQHGASYSNPELALKYLRQGAESGYPWAQRTLGVVSVFGLAGSPQNKSEGLRLLKEAASQSDHDAEYILGSLYESGVTVRANPEAACYWFGRAAPYVPKAAQELGELHCRKAA